MKFQIQIKIHNWDNGTRTVSKEISLNDIQKYTELIKIINKNENNFTWNWFRELPEKWNGSEYELDLSRIEAEFNDHFNTKYDVNDIISFYEKFTSNGADGIDNIKLYKVEEIVL